MPNTPKTYRVEFRGKLYVKANSPKEAAMLANDIIFEDGGSVEITERIYEERADRSELVARWNLESPRVSNSEN